MKITCQRDKLLSAFATVSTVAPARSPKPILQNVKLEVDKSGATLMATDLESGIRMEVAGVEVQSPGAALLQTARFGAILRESSDSQIVVESESSGTTIRGERSQFKLPAANPDEYPPVAAFHETQYHEVHARLFREMIRRTVFATDNESTRYALGGVLLEFLPDMLIAVGTDGRRLATMQGPARAIEGSQPPDTMTIVPTKAMTLIEKALAESNTEVLVAPKSNSLLLKNERTTIFSRLVEGRYPKWREVIPRRDGSARIALTVGPVYAAVRQAAIVTSDESRGIDFTFGEGQMTLVGDTAEVGQSHVELPVAYDGPRLTITLDPRYLMDFLRVLESEKAFTIDIQDSESAALCTTDDGYSYVIMPLARDR